MFGPELALILPFQGSWAGEGVKTKKPKVKAAPPRPLRKDDGNQHVIINPKKDKKIAKYYVPEVPHPFGSMEQYQRTLAAPLGKILR